MMLTAHVALELRLRMNGAIPLFPLYALMVWTWDNSNFFIGAIPLCCSITEMIVQSKHNTIFNNMKFATCFGYK